MNKTKKAVTILLSLAMAGMSVLPAFAAETTIPHALDSGGNVTEAIGSNDFNKGPYEGTYHANDGSALTISGKTLTWSGKSFSTDGGESIDTEYAGLPFDFKTSDGVYGSVFELNMSNGQYGQYSFHPFLNSSGTGIVVLDITTLPNDFDALEADYPDHLLPGSVAYFKDEGATVTTSAKTYKSDTGSKLTVKAGKTYQFKITASSKPTFVCGNSSVFKVTYNGSKGSGYFFKVTAVGKTGQSAGFYINGEKKPGTVGTIG